MALGDLFNPLLAAIKRALGPFGRVFDILQRFWHNLTHLGEHVSSLTTDVRTEIDEWRSFRVSIAYRTGVVSIPAAVRNTRLLLDQLRDAWFAVMDLVETIRGKIAATSGTDPVGEAKEAIADIEKSGFGQILQKFPRLIRGVEKALGFVALIADLLEDVITTVSDLQRIVDAARAIREEVEHGSTVYLQQRNRRETVTLTDGTKMKIRIGNLH